MPLTAGASDHSVDTMTNKSISTSKSQYSIDKDSYEPAYVQMANILRRQISDGVFRPGDLLPSEAQLVRMYGISPMTVRRSINLLAEEDVVSTERGRGTFAKHLELGTAKFDLDELRDLISKGGQSSVKLLDVSIVKADEAIAAKLGLRPGTPTVYLRRLFTQNGNPIFYHRAYLVYDPRRPIVEAEMDVTTLQGLFMHDDTTLLKRGLLSIEPVLIKPEEAEVLKVEMPAAVFNLEHLFIDFNDRPVSWGWFIFRNECLHFTTELGLNL